MRKMLLFLIVLVLLAGQAIPAPLHFPLTVANGASSVKVASGSHIKFSTDTAGVKVAIHYPQNDSSGNLLRILSNPIIPSGTFTAPATGDTMYTLLDTSIKAWNIYNDTPCGTLVFNNTSGGSVTVTVEIIR